MKIRKLLSLLSFLIIASVVLFSCGKETSEPPTQLPGDVSFTAEVSPTGQLESGANAVIKITVVNADSVISDLPGALKLDGTCTKEVSTPGLTSTTIYHFKIYKEAKVDYKNVTVYVNEIVGPPNPTIVLTSSVDTLPVGGGEVTINIVTTSADSVLSIFDGKKLNPNCSEVYIIDTTTTFIYEAYGPGGMKSKSITVVVTEPPLPLTIPELLCLAPWQMVKLELKLVDGDWHEGNVGCSSDDTYTFYFYPQIGVVNFGEIKCDDEPDSGQGPWTLEGNLLDTGDPGGIINEIIQIASDTLVWVYCFNDGSCTRETFIHPPQE
jgi:hypothetical protein